MPVLFGYFLEDIAHVLFVHEILKISSMGYLYWRSQKAQKKRVLQGFSLEAVGPAIHGEGDRNVLSKNYY